MSDVKEGLPFKRNNYLLFAAGTVLVIVGFILMAGGKQTDPDVFNPEVFSFTRITLAPIVVLSGMAVVMFGIFKKFD
jgi:hypothetical protein